ncbi:MAG: hypothetical protein WBO49_02100, partial [Candidatus Saccharimonas sp.]
QIDTPAARDDKQTERAPQPSVQDSDNAEESSSSSSTPLPPSEHLDIRSDQSSDEISIKLR